MDAFAVEVEQLLAHDDALPRETQISPMPQLLISPLPERLLSNVSQGPYQKAYCRLAAAAAAMDSGKEAPDQAWKNVYQNQNQNVVKTTVFPVFSPTISTYPAIEHGCPRCCHWMCA